MKKATTATSSATPRLPAISQPHHAVGPPTGTSKAREVYDEAGNLVGRKGRRGSSAAADDDGDEDEEDE